MDRRRRRAKLELPKRTGRRRAIETAKDLLIVFLSCSAVYLAARSQLYSGLGGDWLSTAAQLLGGESSPSVTTAPAARMRVQPSCIALCTGADLGDGVRERCGIQYDAAAVEKVFDEVSRFLGEALAGAGTPREIARDQWEDALQAPGIYFDLMGSVPLPALAVWLGDQNSGGNLSGTVRRLAVAGTGGELAGLYYINEEDGLYYACNTPVRMGGELAALLNSRGGNGARFAFEAGEAFAMLDPDVLLPADTPALASYTASSPISLEDTGQLDDLQRRLAFRPAGYPTEDGWVNDTLRIGKDGAVRYDGRQSGGGRYGVSMTEEGAVDLAQAVSAARSLAEVLLSPGQNKNEARLYLIGVEQRDNIWEIRFGYTLNGAAVVVDGQETAARFLVGEGRILQYELLFRFYTVYEQTGSLLLPEAQAAAAASAMGPAGQELMLCYTDSGADGAIAEAGWAVR